MLYAKPPVILEPFEARTITAIRKLTDRLRADSINPDDQDQMFNRWGRSNHPQMLRYHLMLLTTAERIFGEALKPTYSYMAVYSEDGICPAHTDRTPCKFTVDLLVSGAEDWPLWVDGNPYILKPGQAICYSGTDQQHERKSMRETTTKIADLVFFHYVPVSYIGPME